MKSSSLYTKDEEKSPSLADYIFFLTLPVTFTACLTTMIICFPDYLLPTPPQEVKSWLFEYAPAFALVMLVVSAAFGIISCRGYMTKPLDRDDLEKFTSLITTSPSAMRFAQENIPADALPTSYALNAIERLAKKDSVDGERAAAISKYRGALSTDKGIADN